MKKISKKYLSKFFLEKAVVLAIVAVFIGSAFVPAIGSQVKNITNEMSSEDKEIKIGTEESINNLVSDNFKDSKSGESLWDRITDWIHRLLDILGDNPVVNRLRGLFTVDDVDVVENVLVDSDLLVDDCIDCDESDSIENIDTFGLDIDTKTDNLNRKIVSNRNNLQPLDIGDPWWHSGWSYRKEITIDSSKVTAALTDFPVLISLADSDLASFTQSNGEDIVFTDQSGTTVFAHEIDYYSSGTLDAWVNVTSLSSSVDTVLYMYFGNGTCPNQENPSGVWDSSFVMVQHMQETSGIHYDSTSNDNDASEYISPDSNNTSGKIAGADFFDTGGDDYLEVVGDLVTGDGTSVSFWEYEMTIGTGYGCVYDDWSGGSGLLWQFGDLSTNFQVGNVGDWGNNLVYAHGGLVDDNWHYYTVTLSGGTIILYEDGSSVSSKSHNTNVAADSDNVQIMRRSDGNYATGKMDELRVSSTARSADWIQTNYNNQYDPDSFFDVGLLETETR